MLVRPRHRKHTLPFQAVIPRNGIHDQRAVHVANMRNRVHVINGRRDVEDLFHLGRHLVRARCAQEVSLLLHCKGLEGVTNQRALARLKGLEPPHKVWEPLPLRVAEQATVAQGRQHRAPHHAVDEEGWHGGVTVRSVSSNEAHAPAAIVAELLIQVREGLRRLARGPPLSVQGLHRTAEHRRFPLQPRLLLQARARHAVRL
ncbi:hypothetical protein, conserved in T. vivax, (fragment), partial [Trypanosoma vivax Y486]